MSQYKVIIKEEAQADLKNLLRYEPKAYKKAIRFIGELYDHPKTGLGHPRTEFVQKRHTGQARKKTWTIYAYPTSQALGRCPLQEDKINVHANA